jgi:cyclohexadieny/prephenate dehydrogenase
MSGSVFERITIIGLGLIGSSIARAARQYKLADIIVGSDPNEIALTYARAHKFIDVAMSDPATAIQTTQLVIFAMPPSQMEKVAATIAPALKPGMIVMDTASVKVAAIEAVAPYMPAGVDFVPAHPIAGSEQSGVAAGRADLFQRKRVIVTPDQPTETESLRLITRFWKGMGAHIEGMPATLHDQLYGYVSHLPQLLAWAATAALKDGPKPATESVARFLRLSGSNPVLWSDIFALNSANLIASLDRYLDAVLHVQKELRQAPDDATDDADETLARFTLFPRIAASCLITTVMEAEKKAGFSFARYAGSGFADFTSPAAIAPDSEIEQISNQHRAVLSLLQRYVDMLQSVRALIVSGDFAALRKAFSHTV